MSKFFIQLYLFWRICHDELEFSDPVSMFYRIKLSLKNSARKKSGEDIYEAYYTAGVDRRSTWNKVLIFGIFLILWHGIYKKNVLFKKSSWVQPFLIWNERGFLNFLNFCKLKMSK